MPAGDNRLRDVCTACRTIFYQNPKMVVGCIPEWQGQILLCERAIEPRAGFWTLPAGFMENGETLPEAAARETVEEAGVRVRVEALFSVVSLPHINQVYMLFRATMLDSSISIGPESLQARLFSETEIPWDQLAFPTMNYTLKRYFADARRGQFGLHSTDIFRPAFKRE